MATSITVTRMILYVSLLASALRLRSFVSHSQLGAAFIWRAILRPEDGNVDLLGPVPVQVETMGAISLSRRPTLDHRHANDPVRGGPLEGCPWAPSPCCWWRCATGRH